MTKDLTKKLRAFFKVIVDEAGANEEFAAKIDKALGFSDEPKKKATTTRKRRDPAVLNPIQMIIDGDNGLEEKLYALELSQLKDIIAQYNLDVTNRSRSWRKKERIVGLIMEMARAWATKGDVFR